MKRKTEYLLIKPSDISRIESYGFDGKVVGKQMPDFEVIDEKNNILIFKINFIQRNGYKEYSRKATLINNNEKFDVIEKIVNDKNCPQKLLLGSKKLGLYTNKYINASEVEIDELSGLLRIRRLVGNKEFYYDYLKQLNDFIDVAKENQENYTEDFDNPFNVFGKMLKR